MRQIIEINKKDIKRIENLLGNMHKRTPNVIANAANRAATTIVASIKKEVRSKYHIKAGDIQNTIVRKKATRSTLYTEVRSKGNLIGLDKFKVLPKNPNPKRKKPIRVAVKKEGGAKQLVSSFVADIYGNKVFERKGKNRLPIQRLFGPSVPQMIDNADVRNKIEQAGIDMFSKRLEHEMNRLLEKGGK